jgi:hypothetical protein
MLAEAVRMIRDVCRWKELTPGMYPPLKWQERQANHNATIIRHPTPSLQLRST